jgi:YD repeat-containing protein
MHLHDRVRRLQWGLKAAVFCLLLQIGFPAPAHLDEVQYVYDDLGRLIAVIDSAGEAAIYTYDAVGNLQSITRSAAGQVAIFTFSPQKGSEGTAVTLRGIGFSPTPSQNQVVFGGGVTATVSGSTNTTIETIVPVGAVTGPISVTTPSGSAVSQTPFEVAASETPVITSISPTFGFAGETMEQFSITGENLEDALEVRFIPQDGIIVSNPPVVTLNGTQATVRVTIIASAPLGARVVTITNPVGTSSTTPSLENSFTVLPNEPIPAYSGIVRVLVQPPPSAAPPQETLGVFVEPDPNPAIAPYVGVEVQP